jgi:hypothetical protein
LFPQYQKDLEDNNQREVKNNTDIFKDQSIWSHSQDPKEDQALKSQQNIKESSYCGSNPTDQKSSLDKEIHKICRDVGILSY